MFFFLSKLLDVFLSPLCWAIVLLALAIPLRRNGLRHENRRRLCGALALGILVLFGSGPVANALLFRLEHSAPSSFHDDVVYDAVILLGGVTDDIVTFEEGQPAYNDNVERLVMTHRLLADGKAKFAIVSGAAVSPKYEAVGEARYLARQLEEWGIAPSRVIVEDRARNTHENAVYSEEIVRARGLSRVLVVTSAFHMARSRECFAAVGMQADYLPVDYRAHERPFDLGLLPRAKFLSVSEGAIHEWFGRWIYRVRGYGKPVS
ncbi:Putative membrane protein [Labilithrix luteola]|uniref:Putative membrane protein n=1 Tax=Labilithrix luteola TaxID=1391654 RepID=A0A0K1PQM5_9BACT|nr:YdcF family protein [Labilithrix luteola]AKU95419.1 Putative membrane protein [Labilithrix luteola]